MLGARSGLELWERYLSEHRNAEDTEEMASKVASSPWVSTESVRIESRACSNSLTAWSKKGPCNPCWFGDILQ